MSEIGGAAAGMSAVEKVYSGLLLCRDGLDASAGILSAAVEHVTSAQQILLASRSTQKPVQEAVYNLSQARNMLFVVIGFTLRESVHLLSSYAVRSLGMAAIRQLTVKPPIAPGDVLLSDPSAHRFPTAAVIGPDPATDMVISIPGGQIDGTIRDREEGRTAHFDTLEVHDDDKPGKGVYLTSLMVREADLRGADIITTCITNPHVMQLWVRVFGADNINLMPLSNGMHVGGPGDPFYADYLKSLPTAHPDGANVSIDLTNPLVRARLKRRKWLD